MATATKMIFGIRTSETLSLSVTASGQLPPQPPPLRIKTSEHDVEIAFSGSAWAATLSVGDHVVYMPAPGDSWFEAPLAFTLSTSATIVGYTEMTRGQLVHWTATAGTIGDNSKNPWPPPVDGGADISSLASSTWLSSTLTTMKAEISLERSDSADALPASKSEARRFR